jgi:hypothetical protein
MICDERIIFLLMDVRKEELANDLLKKIFGLVLKYPLFTPIPADKIYKEGCCFSMLDISRHNTIKLISRFMYECGYNRIPMHGLSFEDGKLSLKAINGYKEFIFGPEWQIEEASYNLTEIVKAVDHSKYQRLQTAADDHLLLKASK